MDWDKAFDEIAQANAKAYDSIDPIKAKERADAEFQRGVRLGWWDAEGNPIAQDDDDDEDEDETAEGDE